MSTKFPYQHAGFYRFYLAGIFTILALPLLNWPIYFYPPNWAKTLVFQIVFITILFALLCNIAWNRNLGLFNKIKGITIENAGFWLLLAFFATQFLATVFSLDFKYSLFGSPYRGGGFITYGLYIIFAIFAFLVVKDKDWQKLWDASIGVGVAVCGLALITWLGLFSDFFIVRLDNISSTIGGPNTLALYLLLLIFPALSLGVATGSMIKKACYLSAFALFCFVLVLTISQGAYLGLAAGMGYFLMLYPAKNLPEHARKKVFYGKIAIICLLAIAMMGAILLKNAPANSINSHRLFKQFTTWKVDQSRLSTWQIAWKAFLQRPVLGYGPENFSIGFDKNYDPSLPLLEMEPGTPASWWDKAHNFAFSLLVESGILGFAAFALLFGWIFWRLRKVNLLIAHGLQATLVAYFTNLVFNFENFSSYIIIFLIVGHSLHLTIPAPVTEPHARQEVSKIRDFLFRKRKVIASTGFLLLISFIWFFNIKPFNANAQINKAKYLADNGRCEQAIALMNRGLKKQTIIDGYLRIKYVELIINCLQIRPENDIAYAKQIIPAIQENVLIMPHYPRNWLWLVAFNNMIAVAETDVEKKKIILDQNREYLKKAESLSPQRHEILVEKVNFEIYEGNYEKARQISESCTKKYPDFNACYWYLGLSQIYLSKDDASLLEGKKNMEKAQNLGYSQLSQYSLTQLAFLYINKNNYKELEWVYERLTQYNPYNPRYFAGLALVYKKNGKLEESGNAIKEILRIQSDAKSIEQGWVETKKTIVLLLENILGVQESSSDYHLALYELYREMTREEKDPVKSKFYQQKAEEEYKLSMP